MYPLALLLLTALAASADPLSLWYRQPAATWTEALPVGNGRIGAMVFGRVAEERIQFNEHTVWTGEPHDYAHPGASQYLKPLRDLLFQGRQKEAEDLAMREFMSIPLGQKTYQPFGDLNLRFPGHSAETAKRYGRDLDLDTAIATTTYQHGGVTYRREVFVSHPAQALIVRLTASKKGALNFEASLASPHPNATVQSSSGLLILSGSPASSAIRFEARMQVLAEGGTRQLTQDRVVVAKANAATILLTGATNFVSYRDVSADPAARNQAVFAKLEGRGMDVLRTEHVADHQRAFRRVQLDLGHSPAAKLPTDERIRGFATATDPQLVTLLFQYGRYLLLGSSRPGGQPANLQGLWNESLKPAWDSKYTVNINAEMNYWPAEVANLAECTGPLFDALKELAASGASTARQHYNAQGWVLHHNFDLWRGTAPINHSNHGIWPTGGAWLAMHLWEHYLYSGDTAFLRDSAYPLMKDAALFFTDTLVAHPDKPWLITGPSNSPEQGGLVMGPTMDHQIVRSLFGAVIAAARILNTDQPLQQQLTDMRARIAPNQIGKHGQLQEWLEDVDDPKNQHRHVSHLWAVYPGVEITSLGTPDLFAAARQSLEFRGDAATGWSMGWKLNLWARFLDGAHAYRILQNLVTPAAQRKPGLYPNLFDAHPPFQIDGNFGLTAAVAEMLLQSHDPHAKPLDLTPVQTGQAAFLNLLPALPPNFAAGRVTGLRARGGLTVDLAWRNGKLAKATLRPERSLPVTLRYGGKQIQREAVAGQAFTITPAQFQ